MKRQFLFTPFLLIALISSAAAQTPKPADQVALEVCNDEFARQLVDQQVAESRTVTEAAKRVRILIRSADFLWRLDQPTGRAYFTEAFKAASDHFAEKGFESKQEKGGLTIMGTDHRFEVIRAIAKKDGEWSKRLTEQLLKEYEKNAAERNRRTKTERSIR
jgi:hypothetical protein